jgi:hypothetical protein
MKPKPVTTHEAPELMRVFGAELLEEKKVYGAPPRRQKRHPAQPQPRRPPAVQVK